MDSRNIKFRGNRVDGQGLVYGGTYKMWVLYDEYGDELAYDNPRLAYFIQPENDPAEEVHPESVAQWTGLQDKNKVDEVYDDDLCLIRVDFSSADADKSDLRELKVRIFYDDEMFAWCWNWKEHDGQGNLTCTFAEHEFDVLKVIPSPEQAEKGKDR